MPDRVSAPVYTITIEVQEDVKHVVEGRRAGATFQIDQSIVYDLLYATPKAASAADEVICTAAGKAIVDTLKLLNGDSSTQVSESLTDEDI